MIKFILNTTSNMLRLAEMPKEHAFLSKTFTCCFEHLTDKTFFDQSLSLKGILIAFHFLIKLHQRDFFQRLLETFYNSNLNPI